MFSSRFAPGLRKIGLGLTVTAAILFAASPINASTLWNWEYTAAGIAAGGTLTTVDTPDQNGGFLITAITGARNGEAITGLQPAGTPIPGNEPFNVDDLIFLGPGPQLTGNGFGFSTADGNFSNPFFADFLPAPAYLEFFSAPPFVPGTPGPEDSELPVQFSATQVATPEPASFMLVLGAAGLATLRLRRRVLAD